MSFVQAIKVCMSKSFDFSGRASRSEFWFFVLFISIIHTAFFNWSNQQPGTFSFNFGFNLVLSTEAPWWANLYTAIFTLPFLSALARRAHDVNVNASILAIIPFVAFAAIVMLLKLFPTQQTYTLSMIVAGIGVLGTFFYLTLKKSDLNTNRFGPNPHEVPS